MKITKEITHKTVQEIELKGGTYYYKILDKDAFQETYFELTVNEDDEEFTYIRVNIEWGEANISKKIGVLNLPYLVEWYLFDHKEYSGEVITKEQFLEYYNKAWGIINLGKRE